MRAISSNVSEVLAARLSVYDSVGCDDAVTDCILMVALPYPRSWRERIEAPRPAILPDILQITKEAFPKHRRRAANFVDKI